MTGTIDHRIRFWRHERARPNLQLDQPDDLSVLRPGTSPRLTVVVPTRNDADSVLALLGRLAQSLDGVVAEVLFVDNSTDETPAVIRSIAPLAA